MRPASIACRNAAGHRRNVARGGDRGVCHDRGRAHFHGFAGLRGAADACVHDDGQVDLVDQDLDEFPCRQALVRTDRRTEWHDARRARAGQVAGNIQIRVHVRHDDKALFGEDFGRAYGFLIVGQQVFAVAHDLDFDKVAAATFARQARDAHGLLRVARARGIGQQGHARGDIVQNVGHAAFIRTAQREGNDLCARVMYGGVDQVERIFARTEDEAGGEFMPAQNQLVCHKKHSFFCEFLLDRLEKGRYTMKREKNKRF